MKVTFNPYIFNKPYLHLKVRVRRKNKLIQLCEKVKIERVNKNNRDVGFWNICEGENGRLFNFIIHIQYTMWKTEWFLTVQTPKMWICVVWYALAIIDPIYHGSFIILFLHFLIKKVIVSCAYFIYLKLKDNPTLLVTVLLRAYYIDEQKIQNLTHNMIVLYRVWYYTILYDL